MSVSPWKPIEKKVYHHSKFRRILDVTYELPDGRKEVYSLNDLGKVVCVLALTEDRKVVLARQFRPGPNAILDELPGGGVDQDEATDKAVVRELLEETGYAPGRLIPLGRFFECAYSTIERHGFLAVGCKKVSDQKLDSNEFIETVLKPLPEFIDQIKRGLISDAEVAWAGLFEAGLVQLSRT